MSDYPVQASLPEGGRFYGGRDLAAGGIAWAVALAGYLWTLAPSVTMEDSGEFLTAAYQLGVPHPPGYPIWTILAWLWYHLIPIGNIAWRINLMSAFFSALACGLCALLVSKSGHVLARKVGYLHADPNQRLVDLIVMSSSICAGLLLAFSPVMWSQAVITEVYGLNAFCLMATLVVLYRWSFEPERRWWLYLAAFIWGVGLTVHQTLVLLTVAFPVFIWLTDRKLGRDVLVPILVVIVGGVLYSIVQPGSMFREGVFSGAVLLAIGVGAAVWLYRLWQEGPGVMQHWPQVLAVYAAVLLGLALYGYLYLSSSTNPPMNWGHCSQWDGFRHHFTRGQYDKVHTERTIVQLWGQLNMFFDDLQGQFNILYALLALLTLFFFRDLGEGDRNWLKFLFIGFLCLGLGFIFLSNPTFDRQRQFTDRVFFLPCHCIYALWIGYGLILGLGYLFTTKPGLQSAVIPLAAVVLLLPVGSWWRNWKDQEERGHDFGYRFGYQMFKPGHGYPEMDRDAVLYGGTDPGRFVPTYMIFVESVVPSSAKSHVAKCPESDTFDRRDVYIITQNALADATYMAYIRDHYDYSRPRMDHANSLTNRSGIYRALLGWAWKTLDRESVYPKEPIWIPTVQDSQAAFGKYIEELRTRAPMPGEDVKVDEGRVSVQGVAGVMAINGILTKDIFEHNKDKHSFYVEESYVIPWMYPYLEPYGIIMKFNSAPLPGISPAMVARDKAYWEALSADLNNDPKFHRDDVAQKVYSKLRSAIGGLYASRRMFNEAEDAYRQAIELCPVSPEANFRLAQLYVERRRFDDAINILERYQKLDTYNSKIREAIGQVKKMQGDIAAISDLEKQLAAQPGKMEIAMQLARAYAIAQQIEQFDALVDQLIAAPQLSQDDFLVLINFNAQLNRGGRVVELLTAFTQRHPQNGFGWFNLATMLSLRGDCPGGMVALERALALDGADQRLHDLAQREQRLANCRNNPDYQRLLGKQPSVVPPQPDQSNLPFKVGK